LIFIIYKETKNEKTGQTEKIDIIECDADEANARKFSRLYNLQIPIDMRHKVSYNYMQAAE
jgi:hypothetical protein